MDTVLGARTVVVVGGTSGLGRAVALERLRRGDRVIVVGRDPRRGADLLAHAGANAARAHFVDADLSLVGEARRVIAAIRELTARVDALVLCARYFRSDRVVTSEGFEYTFALLYLSRFVLSHEMLDLLVAAPRPVILNVAGPGSGTDAIRWDDLGAESGYVGATAQAQAGQLNDLLALEFARRRAAPPVSYVLAHPGVVDTAMSGDYDEDDAAHVAAVRARARTVGEAVAPLLQVLEDPPEEPLRVLHQGERIDLGADADGELGDRLFALTTTLLARFTAATPGVDPGRLHRLLDSPVFATVATLSRGGRPHQTVVWIDRDGDDVVFTIARGSAKERHLRRDPRVSVLVGPPTSPYTYATMQGTVRLAADDSGRLLDRLARKYTGHDHAEHHDDAAAHRSTMVVARFTPERILGRL